MSPSAPLSRLRLPPKRAVEQGQSVPQILEAGGSCVWRCITAMNGARVPRDAIEVAPAHLRRPAPDPHGPRQSQTAAAATHEAGTRTEKPIRTRKPRRGRMPNQSSGPGFPPTCVTSCGTLMTMVSEGNGSDAQSALEIIAAQRGQPEFKVPLQRAVQRTAELQERRHEDADAAIGKHRLAEAAGIVRDLSGELGTQIETELARADTNDGRCFDLIKDPPDPYGAQTRADHGLETPAERAPPAARAGHHRLSAIMKAATSSWHRRYKGRGLNTERIKAKSVAPRACERRPIWRR